MSFRNTFLLLCLIGYTASGLYVVRGNEQAVVRRFGRALPGVVGSGLHFDLPWPFSRVDRVNQNEIRTVSLGLAAADEIEPNDFLRAAASSRSAEFLTGDKNILHLQVHVQYRITEPHDYLLRHEAPERYLRLLAECVVADAVARSGVDFVHPLGLNELRQFLTQRTRELAESHRLGVTIEDVTIGDVRPPTLVKQAFLDVSNARAERDRMINEAHAEGEKMIAQAKAQALQEIDRAETERHRLVSEARGDADRFLSLIGQFERDAATGEQSRQQARAMAMQRIYQSALEEILPRLAGQVFVDGTRPIDLTIQPNRE